MMQRLQISALTLALAGFAGIAFGGMMLPWERRVFGSTTQGIGTELGYFVFISMLVIGALLIGRFVEYTDAHRFELPILGIAAIALIMLVFYVVQIGRVDLRIADSTRPVEAGDGFFLTLGAVMVIEVTVAGHYVSRRWRARTDTTHADA